MSYNKQTVNTAFTSYRRRKIWRFSYPTIESIASLLIAKLHVQEKGWLLLMCRHILRRHFTVKFIAKSMNELA